MTSVATDRRRRVASLVIRPIDQVRARTDYPPGQLGPIRPVSFAIAGKVLGGELQPLRTVAPVPVRNLSGDIVFRDLSLPAGTYRIELRGLGKQEGTYEDIGFEGRDFPWDPIAPLGSRDPDLEHDSTWRLPPAHPSRLLTPHLSPGPSYPFPRGLTVVRGQLVWYDGTGLEGAVVSTPSSTLARIDRSRIGARGDFVLVFLARPDEGPWGNDEPIVPLELDDIGVDAAAKPEGADYLAEWVGLPSVKIAVATTHWVRQPSLTGRVVSEGGRPLEGAVIRLVNRAGRVSTDVFGRWAYHFPPSSQSGTVDVTVKHDLYPDVTLSEVPFKPNQAASAPTVVMS